MVTIVFLLQNAVLAQYVPPSDTTCFNAMPLCADFVMDFDARRNGVDCDSDPYHLWFSFSLNDNYSPQSLLINITSDIPTITYQLLGEYPNGAQCSEALGDLGTAYSSLPVHGNSLLAGKFYLVLELDRCYGHIEFDFAEGKWDCTEQPCENCIPSFAPLDGESYLITAWVKEVGATADVTEYTEPAIYVDFPGTSSTGNAIMPTGLLIDSWQRIEGRFVVPVGAETIKIRLTAGTTVDVLYDDIRVFPEDGSMKCYVYDPIDQRLKAELDERHYATFYEYDGEGKLVRIKKETERGVMTVQEQRDNSSKISGP